MKNKSFLSENFQFFEVKFSIYLNRLVFVMNSINLEQTGLQIMPLVRVSV